MAKTAVEPPGHSGSQFFVVTAPADAGLPPDYAVLGEVTEGIDVVEAIGELGDPDRAADAGRDHRRASRSRPARPAERALGSTHVQDRDRRPGTRLRARRAPAARPTGSPTIRGSWVILAFYPGRLHPGLHAAVLLLPRRRRPPRRARRRVLGISPQSVDSHERFAAEHGLTVPLLADPDHETARAYGVVAPGGLVRRSIFIVDPEGIVRYRHVALLGLRYKDVEHLGGGARRSRATLRGRERGEPRAVRARRGRRPG